MAAARIADRVQREAYLAGACDGNPRRRETVAKLLAARDAAAASPLDVVLRQLDPFDLLANADLSKALASSTVPRSIGPYRLLEPIGEGGFGSVYLAEQTAPLRRQVALKLIKPGMDSKEVIARFEAERQALALMEHPNIARVVDAGSTPENHPYFVMELVRGLPITDYCKKACLTIRQRVELFLDVCRAVQHAHQKGIIHRDLKPSNVMVTMHDHLAVVKVIDFGVAKALKQQLTEQTLFTRYGYMVGTPRYMSPEQAQFSGIDIDTRSDVYSLGVMLYELLTGTTPVEKEHVHQASFDELRRMICEVDPPRPSTRLSTLATAHLSTAASQPFKQLQAHVSALRGELDWIVMKALEKDRRLRYDSASALADDLQRYLADEPVEACPPSWRYRLQKFVRRHKPALATLAIVATSLIVGTAVATRQAIRATQAEALAQSRFNAANLAALRAGEARQQAQHLALETRRLLSRSYVETGISRIERNEIARALPWFVAALKADGEDSPSVTMHRTRLGMMLRQCPKLVGLIPSGDRAYRLLGPCACFDKKGRPLTIELEGNRARVYDLAAKRAVGPAFIAEQPLVEACLSPDGSYGVVGAGMKRWLWEVASGTEILEFEKLSETDTYNFSGDGKRLALIRHPTGTGAVWETSTGEVIDSLEPTEYPRFPRFSHDGRRLVFPLGAGTASIGIWKDGGATVTHMLQEHKRFVYDAQFSHDGRRLVTASFDTTARLCDAQTLAPVGLPMDHDDYVWSASFSPDDSMVVTVSGDSTARLWDATTGLPRTPPLEHAGELKSAAFSADGRYVITASWDNTARIWDADTGKLAYPVLAHHTQVDSVDFDPLGRRVLTVTSDGLVHLWDLAGAFAPGLLIDHGRGGFGAEFTPDGRGLLTAGWGGRLWDTNTGQPLGPPLPLIAMRAAFSASGERLAVRVGSSAVQVFQTSTMQPVSPLLKHDWNSPPSWQVSRPSLGLEGRYVLSTFIYGVSPGDVTVWEVDSGKPTMWPVNDARNVLCATFSDDGRTIATGSAVSESTKPGGYLQLWSGTTGTPLHPPIEHPFPVTQVLFSRDSRRIATVCAAYHSTGGEVRVYDVASQNLCGTPIQQASEFHHADLSPDASRIAVSGRDETARVWDIHTGQPLTPPLQHHERITSVRFSPDGRTLLTTSGVGNLNSEGPAYGRLWDANTGQLVSPPLRLSDAREVITAGAFSADGRRISAVNRGGTTRTLSTLPSKLPLDTLELLAELLSARKVEAVGGVSPISKDDRLTAWNKLRASNPDAFEVSQQQIAAWRHAEVVALMKSEHWSEALAHLDVLIEDLPEENFGLRLRRIECARALKDWKTYAADYHVLIKHCPNNIDLWSYNQLALLELKLGNPAGYRTACVAMLERFASSENSEAASLAVETAILGLGGVDDYEPLIKLARRISNEQPEMCHFRFRLGASLVRADRCDQALEPLTAALPDVNQRRFAYYFLAMAHHRLGHDEEAQRSLEQANVEGAKYTSDQEKYFWVLIACDSLRAETEAVLAETSGQ